MSRSHTCTRSFTREALNKEDWIAFFRNETTPYVFLDRGDGNQIDTMDNIVGYVSRPAMDEHGFTYVLHHISEAIDEEVFLDKYTVEVVFTKMHLNKRVIGTKIDYLVLVPNQN